MTKEIYYIYEIFNDVTQKRRRRIKVGREE